MTDSDFNAWLADRHAQRVLLIDADYYDEAADAVGTLHLSHNLYNGAASDAWDGYPSYKHIVRTVPNLDISLPEALTGAASPSWGNIIIDNSSGVRDHWLDYGFDGRRLRIRLGGPDWPQADFRPIFNGYIADIAAPEVDTLALQIRDGLYALNDPIQDRLIGEPEHVEGTLTWRLAWSRIDSVDSVCDMGEPVAYTADLEAGTITLATEPVGRVSAVWHGGDGDTPARNQPLPLGYGRIFNAEPVLVDAGLHLYRLHAGQIKAVRAVMDNGEPVGYTTDLDAGTITLNEAPYGRVTVHFDGAVDDEGFFPQSVAEIIKHIILTRSTLTEADLDLPSFDRFNLGNPAPVAIYINERLNTIEVLGQLAASAGGFIAPRRNGRIALGRIRTDVSGVSAGMALADDDGEARGLTLKRRILPLAEITIGYQHNHAPLSTSEIAADVDEANKAMLRQACLRIHLHNESALSRHPGARKPALQETRLVLESDAQALAASQMADCSALRHIYALACRAQPATLELGDVVSIDAPRYGFSGGRLAVVTAIKGDLSQPRHVLEILI